MNAENLDVILETLVEVIKEKSLTIRLQQYEIADLKSKIENAEREKNNGNTL